MEAFGIMGFIFGITAMGLAKTASTKLQGIAKELAELKQELTDSGVVKAESQNKEK